MMEIINTIGLIIVALIQAITAYRIHKKVTIVEKSTNSMKDDLVSSTAKAAYAEGELKGRRDVRAELNSRSVK